ncbi:hypothetical protein [Novosphingobium endophyticum]|nr:hypothetical protein [Novosphingobium endophyticum]
MLHVPHAEAMGDRESQEAEKREAGENLQPMTSRLRRRSAAKMGTQRGDYKLALFLTVAGQVATDVHEGSIAYPFCIAKKP